MYHPRVIRLQNPEQHAAPDAACPLAHHQRLHATRRFIPFHEDSAATGRETHPRIRLLPVRGLDGQQPDHVYQRLALNGEFHNRNLDYSGSNRPFCTAENLRCQPHNRPAPGKTSFLRFEKNRKRLFGSKKTIDHTHLVIRPDPLVEPPPRPFWRQLETKKLRDRAFICFPSKIRPSQAMRISSPVHEVKTHHHAISRNGSRGFDPLRRHQQ